MKTHDYTINKWGHSYHVVNYGDKGATISLAGWGIGIKPNDFILLRNGSDSTRYKITSIEYTKDPVDMWFAEASFSPREVKE